MHTPARIQALNNDYDKPSMKHPVQISRQWNKLGNLEKRKTLEIDI